MSDVIWTSFGNANRVGDEVDKLIEALASIMESREDVAIDRSTNDDDSIHQESEWVTTTYLFSYRFARRRGRPPAPGTVTFVVDLWRREDENGTEWPAARQAKLYIGYVPSARGSGWTVDTLWVGGDGHSEHARPMSPRRWAGTGGGTMASAWFFCVSLADLQTRDDLIREVADPLAALIRGTPEAAAFVDCRSTLIPPGAA